MSAVATQLANVTPLYPKAKPQVWLSPEQVCAIVPGMTERKLLSLRGKGQGPRYSKPTSKTVVYAEADVHAWLAAHMQKTQDQS